MQLAQVLLVLFALKCAHSGILLIGTESSTLYSVQFNVSTGSLTLINQTTVQNPSFLALDPSRRHIYLVNELSQWKNTKNSGGLSAYRVDATGGVSLINSVATRGTAPAHVAVDKTGKWVGVANYGSGNYAMWRINQDSSIAKNSTFFQQDTGKGPNPQQDGPHAHEFVFDPSNSFVVVPDLGNDSWNQYLFNSHTGRLTPASPPSIQAAAGTGPRHIAFHPTLPYAYGVSELASTITTFSAARPLTTLKFIEAISTLPAPRKTAAAAEVQFSADGTMLYVSNRLGDDQGNWVTGSLAAFKIDSITGNLTSAGFFSTQGIHPRFFTYSKDHKFIIVANQLSNNLVVLAVDPTTGLIGKTVSVLNNISAPSHVLQL